MDSSHGCLHSKLLTRWLGDFPTAMGPAGRAAPSSPACLPPSPLIFSYMKLSLFPKGNTTSSPFRLLPVDFSEAFWTVVEKVCRARRQMGLGQKEEKRGNLRCWLFVLSSNGGGGGQTDIPFIFPCVLVFLLAVASDKNGASWEVPCSAHSSVIHKLFPEKPSVCAMLHECFLFGCPEHGWIHSS